MPNPQPPTSTTPPPKAIPDPSARRDGFDSNAADTNAAPPGQRRSDTNSEDGKSDRVEIGDPVPEDDRTVRASNDSSEEALPAADEDDDDDAASLDRDPHGGRH